MPKTHYIITLLIILLFLFGCTSTIDARPSYTQRKIVDSPTELKIDLEVIQTNIIKGSVDVKVAGKVKNRGNKDAESVTVKAACTGLQSSTINTGVDLINVPAGETAAYRITVLVAPYKVDSCSVQLEY